MRTRRTTPAQTLGFVACGPGFHVWEETRAEALHAARELSRGTPVQATRVGRRPRRDTRARPR